ncbi:MAG: DUF2249 domain-containing protein [Deltaproteobacteria bacterium]|nr:DUF2249 domain-containing protein [Deltaproteobacteria bacterium]
MSRILDVRTLAPKERHAQIFETFGALNRGEAFILVNDHEPKPLLYQFQAEHNGEFDWWPLEQGPKVWRVVVARRKTLDANRTVTEFLQTDHKRLDDIYSRYQEALKAAKWQEAVETWGEFSHGLKRHIRIEEELLFPTFEEKTGMKDAGPTFVMKMEHVDIKELLDQIAASTQAQNERGASDTAYRLTNILTDHNMKEEHILYPESDAFLTEAERSELVKKAQLF